MEAREIAFALSRGRALLVANRDKLRFELVEEERVDYFVDIFRARVVHSPGTTRLRIERALEDSPEDRRRDLRPVDRLRNVLQ